MYSLRCSPNLLSFFSSSHPLLITHSIHIRYPKNAPQRLALALRAPKPFFGGLNGTPAFESLVRAVDIFVDLRGYHNVLQRDQGHCCNLGIRLRCQQLGYVQGAPFVLRAADS